jgi:RNA polymerase sigma factor (sigma-70 family)
LADCDQEKPSPLVALYLEKRKDFLRFFALRTSSAAEAEDIVQEMFLKLAGHDSSGVENPAAYLYRLGTNVMLDRIRARRRDADRSNDYYQAQRTGPAGGEDEADIVSPEAALDAKRRLARLVSAVRDLPPQCQRVFVMHKFQDRSYAEIAQALRISRSAVEKHMINALKNLSDHRS